ncbi:methionine synthase reductase [Maniola hyperantus]|uniref:methionine synthase reductase n=1 Tax=Aphantopus hyperantus TaxID=2795564 RepID=UPI001568D64C|nr:methionine synthase reductase-like [Maniola hyperantus]
MVINHNFLDLFETLNGTKVLNLPAYKENALKINFHSSDERKTVYKGQRPLLPFAASDIFHAPVSSWRRLTAVNENCKAVYECTFDVKGSNLKFRPGDTIGVIPQNSQSEVDCLIEHLNLKDVADCDYVLSIDSSLKSGRMSAHLPMESTLRHVLTHCVDLRGVLKKLFLLTLSRHTKDDKEKRTLEYLCSKEGAVAYTTHILNKHICLLDIFTIFPSCKPPVEVILEHLPRLLPRPYSIANCDKSFIKICFSIIDIGNNRKGLTTGWLERIIIKDDSSIEEEMKNLNINTCNMERKIPIYIRKNINDFYLPENLETPIILIGPGTGVSPFIGFLEERKHLFKVNPEIKLGYTWLFFGCREPKLDFIYEKELNDFVLDGVLNKLTTSFSRCGNTENSYVQDAIQQNGEELTKLLLQGAYVYICGDIKKMAPSVREAIVQCIAKYGDEANEAEEFVENMIKEKRYILDIWN